jgi:hypothetical protein
MKTLNEYMAMSYRMELVEDKDEGDLLPAILICRGVLPAVKQHSQR